MANADRAVDLSGEPMLTVTAETSLSSSPDDTWTALGRRDAYLCFPGISPGRARGALRHDLDLPLLERREQAATLWVGRASAKNGLPDRRFALRGDLVSIAGRWQIAPLDGGTRLQVTLECDIAPALLQEAVTTLRSRSPLPLRTDADAILGRAVEEFLQTRLAEHAAAYCARLRARVDGRQPS
jgi:hypothetical protein